MEPSKINALFETLRDSTDRFRWSRAVEFSRKAGVQLEGESDDELIVQVTHPTLNAAARVSLWLDSAAWGCGCTSPDDPCVHVLAAAMLLTQGKSGTVATPSGAPRVVHMFERRGRALSFERWVVSGNDRYRVEEPLAMLLGGIRSGRVKRPVFAASPEEIAIDAALGMKKQGMLDAATLGFLIPALSRVPHVTLDGAPVKCHAAPLEERIHVRRSGARYSVRLVADLAITERFEQNVVLADGKLATVKPRSLSSTERAALERAEDFSFDELAVFISELVPGLQRRFDIEWGDGCPQTFEVSPDVAFKITTEPDGGLSVMPILRYGEPPLAEIRQDKLVLLQKGVVPLRDRSAEQRIANEVRLKDQLSVGQGTRFPAHDAGRILERFSERNVFGATSPALSVHGELRASPEFSDETNGLRIRFEIEDERGEVREADPALVFDAWRRHQSLVPLGAGAGFGRLPHDWLDRYGDTLRELLSAPRDDSGASRLRDARIARELGTEPPPDLAALEDQLRHPDTIARVTLPADFTGELRPYQRTGLAWLQLLQRMGVGGILADDMGLGKTLQAVCALRFPALVVAPTSVLFSWRDHVRRFRPEVSVCEFHGAGREFDEGAYVVLTTYGLLRNEQERLAAREWEVVVLDEGHVIKNPDSLVAQAAFSLRAKFKLSLTGTPIENRPTDLWSQVQFVNPGALGSRSVFEDRFAKPIASGDIAVLERLEERVRPFLLRRRKDEVLNELPEKSEMVLMCELTEEERGLYTTLRSSVRADILRMLEVENNVLGALELLLRLRQCCCHRGLVPGVTRAATSSKVELLYEQLESSLALGHRALVFSQWTGFLDLIEPGLSSRGVRFGRLDGSTANREEVVKEFQAKDGPPVMLLSLKAGGLGLTLTAADHVYIMDPWWNPTVEDQALSRSHRMGQKNPVFVYRLVAKDTVEERILELQNAKRLIANQILEKGGAALALSSDQLRKDELAALLE